MSNTDQIEYWNGKAGEKWVEFSNHLDAMLAPFAEAVLDAAHLEAGQTVLDVGCGGGALSLLAAKQIGADANITGVDVSAPLLALARKRAADAGITATFKEADASEHKLPTPADRLISRFGVMFFADPAAAFANLRQNMKSGGKLSFACWQNLALNDWARAPLEAALPFLDTPPTPPPPGAPGPFAFQDPAHVDALLTKAGWSSINVTPWTGDITLPGETATEAAAFMMKLGPAAKLVADAGVALEPVEEALRDRMASMAGPDGRVAMKSAVWIVTANAS